MQQDGAKSSANSDKLRVFISYSRQDAEASDAIVDELIARGFAVTIDRRNLPFGEKWQAELAEFIRETDTVIWLVSAHSIGSEWVNWELDELAQHNKRLVPVMIGDVEREKLPRQLGEIHILPAAGSFDLSRDIDALVTALETDRVWLKEASRLADRAYEWIAKKRPTSLLLRGAPLSAAESWKDRRPSKAPAPSLNTLELILASRQASARRQRNVLATTATVILLLVTAGAFALFQRQEARRNQAESSVQIGQRALAQHNISKASVAFRAALRTIDTQLGRRGLIATLNPVLSRASVWQAPTGARGALVNASGKARKKPER